MSVNENDLNNLLVELFYAVESIEERALKIGRFSDLSLRETHVIEQVRRACSEENSSMSAIAKRLNITKGSLTVAVKTLEKKGYLQRLQDNGDRRITSVLPTERGRDADEFHQKFHKRLVESIMSKLDEIQLKTLMDSLTVIKSFFSENTFRQI